MTYPFAVGKGGRMKTQSPDTHLDAERVQIELLRQATIAQHFHLVRSLTATTRRRAWRAIREANPEASDQEVDLLFVSVHDGQDLADRRRADLAQRSSVLDRVSEVAEELDAVALHILHAEGAGVVAGGPQV